ncbi:MAG: hypothetical protein ACFFA8_11245 [Promethearchaeota archaeon]
MIENILVENLRELGYLLSAIVIPLATVILGRKMFKEKKIAGKFNNIRLITFAIFTCFAIMSILEYLVHLSLSPFLDEIFGFEIDNVNLYSILIGTMVSLGLTLIFFANRWEAFYYVALFFFGGMIIFYFFTGFDAWLEVYIQIAAICSLIFMYLTSFRVKDNGALGLAIFFTLAFSVLIVSIPLVTQILILAYDIFIVIFSLGFFKIFKQEVSY